MTRQPRLAVWFTAVFMLFFARAFMFSTWVSRGPEVKELLGINTVEMGLMTMLYPLAGLIGINFASALVQRFGSRAIAFAGYALATASLALLGTAISGGQLLLTGALLMLIGGPMAIIDFVSNYEGNLADQASRHSLFSAMHGAYGLGMMTAAAVAGVVVDAKVSLSLHYLAISALAAVASLGAALSLPRHAREQVSRADQRRQRRAVLAVWRERKSVTIAFVGFSFIMAEMAAGTWVPLALTNSGFTDAEAAFAFSVFWVVVTVFRLLGGVIVDRLGRFRVVQLSAALTAAGIAVFMADSWIALPYVGLVLWGGGMAIGFPMSVSTMGDDPAKSAARINMIVTVVYIASMTVGPALGAVGQQFGIYTAFAIPLVISVAAAILSPVTKPEPAVAAAD